VRQKLIPYQMKLGQPRESHPFDLIVRHLFEIARQLTHRKRLKEFVVQKNLLA
jgi:hypothetical protein